MCGRIACGLDPLSLCQACTHINKYGKSSQAMWRNSPTGQSYQPNYNVTPGAHVPVLLSAEHLSSTKQEKTSKPDINETLSTNLTESDWVIQPMLWGLVPSWSKDQSGSYKMNNARSDGLMDKVSFKKPLEKGRRCVIIAEGYYEWQTKEGKKQPYYIYSPQISNEIKQEINDEFHLDNNNLEWTGRRLLTMAGIFDIWNSKTKDEPAVYSCSIITTNAHKSLSWIHHRMPAILNGEDEVRNWLNFSEVPLNKALQQIAPTAIIQCHPVSRSFVNNSRIKTVDCIKPVDLHAKRKSNINNNPLMNNWLMKGNKRPKREIDKQDKKIKLEEIKQEEVNPKEFDHKGIRPNEMKQEKLEQD